MFYNHPININSSYVIDNNMLCVYKGDEVQK